MLKAAAALGALLVAGVLTVVAPAAPFTGTFDGAPTTPQRFAPTDYEVTLGAAPGGSPEGAYTTTDPNLWPQHGPDCGAPGGNGQVRHQPGAYENFAFICKDHLMTYINGDAVFMHVVPNQLLDLSSGSGTISWDVSTASFSARDWIAVWVQDWNLQEQGLLDTDVPGHQNPPRNAMKAEQGFDNGAEGNDLWHVESFDANRNPTVIANLNDTKVTTYTPRNAEVRTTFQLDITPGHLRLWLPQFGATLAEGNVPVATWTRGVVTLAHYSYSPDKGENFMEPGATGESNTWHWDNLTIDPAIPFTIIKADHRSWPAGSDTFQFASPAPSGAVLRFEAHSKDCAVQVSFDGGPLQPATRTGDCRDQDNASSFTTAVPQGATRARIVNTPGSSYNEVRNPHIFAVVDPGPTATPTPTVTATSTPTASPTPTVSPTPTSTPTSTPTPVNARCTVRDRNDANTGWLEREGAWRSVATDVWVCAVPMAGRNP